MGKKIETLWDLLQIYPPEKQNTLGIERERDRAGERRGVEKNCLSKRKRSVMSPKEWPVSEISGEWWNADREISGVNRPAASVITPHNFSTVGNIKNLKKENNPLYFCLKKSLYIFHSFLFTRMHCILFVQNYVLFFVHVDALGIVHSKLCSLVLV